MSDQAPMNFYDANGKLWMHLEGSEVSHSITIPKTQYLLQVRAPEKELLTIHGDGRITVSEDASPAETAKQVLDAMREMLVAMQVQQWNAAIESAAENFYCEDDFYYNEIRESILRLKK